MDVNQNLFEYSCYSERLRGINWGIRGQPDVVTLRLSLEQKIGYGVGLFFTVIDHDIARSVQMARERGVRPDPYLPLVLGSAKYALGFIDPCIVSAHTFQRVADQQPQKSVGMLISPANRYRFSSAFLSLYRADKKSS